MSVCKLKKAAKMLHKSHIYDYNIHHILLVQTCKTELCMLIANMYTVHVVYTASMELRERHTFMILCK